MISVICASYNCAKDVKFSIGCLREQTFQDFELIVIDGGSNDGTVEKFEEYKDLISYIVSEEDQGIADAWNKGVKKANGNIICFLNVGDRYHVDFLRDVYECLNDRKFAISYGDCTFISDGRIVGEKKGTINNNLLKGMGFVHTSCACTADVFEKVGLFDTSYKIAIDTDFLVRAMKDGVSFVRCSSKVYMSLGGVSDVKFTAAYHEYLDILSKSLFISNKKFIVYKFLSTFLAPVRKLKKSEVVNLLLRKHKHFLVYFLNQVFQFLPTLHLKKLFLSIFQIKLGERSYILKGCKFYRPGNFSIGRNSVINRDCLIDNRGNIEIGDNVSIAHCVSIYTAGHDINSPFNDLKVRDVRIGKHAQIFSNCLIMPGVEIGDGAVVLPGSVVTKRVEPYKVVGGVPAVVVGERAQTLYYKNQYPFWYAM